MSNQLIYECLANSRMYKSSERRIRKFENLIHIRKFVDKYYVAINAQKSKAPKVAQRQNKRRGNTSNGFEFRQFWFKGYGHKMDNRKAD